MDRWSGVLKVPLDYSTRNYYRIAASLCLSSSSSKTLAVPSANAIFFNGDRVRGTGNPVIERLSDLQKVAEILVSKFGNTVNAWVVEASVYAGPFAVYRDFVPSVNQWGEPKTYSLVGFPASLSTVSLLSNCLQEVKKLISKDRKESCSADSFTSHFYPLKTVVLGFSKGGIVLNQLVSELSFLDVKCGKTLSAVQEQPMVGEARSNHEYFQIIPTSKESFLNSISEIHYVDVGLNSTGAYITDHGVIQRISQRLVQGANAIRFILHGTPRQWSDEQRGWINNEKDELVRLLRSEAEKSGGKLQNLTIDVRLKKREMLMKPDTVNGRVFQ